MHEQCLRLGEALGRESQSRKDVVHLGRWNGNSRSKPNLHALFQAIVARFVEEGLSPAEIGGTDQWRHDIVTNNIGRLKNLVDSFRDDSSVRQFRKDYKRIRSRRETADYGPGFVRAGEVREDLDDARMYLRKLGVTP